MLVELLRPATPELARRWLAAMLLVPESERAGVVAAVERQIIATYEHARSPDVDLVHPPVAREDCVEQVVVTYAGEPLSQDESSASVEKRARRPAHKRAQTRA